MKAKTDISGLLDKVSQAMKEIYNDRLVQCILYGSFARGDATDDSDVDIAIVLKGEVDKIAEISRVNDAVFKIGLDADKLISVYPVSEDEFLNSIWPLYHHMKKEGVVL